MTTTRLPGRHRAALLSLLLLLAAGAADAAPRRPGATAPRSYRAATLGRRPQATLSRRPPAPPTRALRASRVRLARPPVRTLLPEAFHPQELGSTLRQAARGQLHVWQNPYTGRQQRVRLTPAEEVQLGDASAPAMVGRYGGLVRHPAITGYVDAVGRAVVERAGVAGAYPFRFHVLGAELPNAFALPGGHVFVTIGMLRRVRSEAQLAALLGHEVAHVLSRHGSEGLVRQEAAKAAFERAASIALEQGASRRDIYAIADELEHAVMSHSQEAELEADTLGIDLQQRAGYDAQGIVEQARLLASMEQGDGRDDPHASHPSAQRRLARMAEHVNRNGAHRGELGDAAYWRHVGQYLN